MCRVVVLLIKPIVFLPFSMTSTSSLKTPCYARGSTPSVSEYDEYLDLRGYRVLIRFGLSKEESK